MYLILDVIVKVVAYCLILYGLWLLIGVPFLQTDIESGYRNWKRKRKIRRIQELNNVVKPQKEPSMFIKHLELLLNSISKSGKKPVMNFMILSILITIVTLTVLVSLISDLVFSIVISMIFGMLPYYILRFKLTTLRLKTQFAFLNEYHTIVQNYQSTGRDIYYTIQNVVKDTKDKDLKRIYMKLLSSLQKDRSYKDFNKAVTLFSYSINSTFSKRFAKLLLKAHVERADVSVSLLDLNMDIKKRKQDMQTEKTNKLETVIMGYLPIPLFPLMVFCAYRISGIRDFWFYFQQTSSMTVFITAFVCSIISVLTAFVASKPRADI